MRFLLKRIPTAPLPIIVAIEWGSLAYGIDRQHVSNRIEEWLREQYGPSGKRWRTLTTGAFGLADEDDLFAMQMRWRGIALDEFLEEED